MNKKLLGIVVLGLLWCNLSLADYYVTGQIQGANKKLLGLGFSTVNVDAVKIGGEFYSLQKVYKKVSEYNKKKGRCWINTELGQIGKVLNLFRGHAFYEKMNDGSYEKLNLEYITFPCVQR